MTEHKCPNCGRELNWNEFLKSNKNKYSLKQIEKFWNSQYLQFYCCTCYKKLRKIDLFKLSKLNEYKNCSKCNAKIDIEEYYNTYSTFSIDYLINSWIRNDLLILCQNCYKEIQRKDFIKKNRKKIKRIIKSIRLSNQVFLIDLFKECSKTIPKSTTFSYNKPNFTIGKRNIKALNLINLNLERLPDSIGNLTDLEILYLDSNKLTSIPSSIRRLKFLRELRLVDNHLSSLPKTMSELKSLKILNLDGNNFDFIPELIKNFKSLKYLDISNNPIKKEPHFFGELDNLKILYAISLENHEIQSYLLNNLKKKLMIVV